MERTGRSMIRKVFDTLTGRIEREAVEENCKTAKSVVGAYAEAKAKADAEAIEKERLERVGSGKEGA